MDETRRNQKHDAIRAAESAGEVADSMEVPMALMERVRKGEISLNEAQSELKRIKRNAKRDGKTTRNQVFRRS